jgi:hypothetical protein
MFILDSAILRSFAFVAAATLWVQTPPATAATASISFPEYFSKDPANPMRLLAQKSFTTRDGYTEEAVRDRTRTAEPFGNAGHVVARVRIPADFAKPITFRVDAATAIDAKQGERVKGRGVEMRLALVCRSPHDVCQNARPESLAILEVGLSPHVKFRLNPWSYDGTNYTRVTMDGVEGTLVDGQGSRTLERPPALWTEADVVVSFPGQPAAAKSAPVIRMRVSLLQGEFAQTEPTLRSRMRVWLKPLGIGRGAVAMAAAALLFMGFVAWRAERNEDAPRTFGALLFLWSSLLACAPIVFYLLHHDTQGTLYYTATGLLFAVSGVYAFFGRPAATSWYAAGYWLAIGWTFTEFDVFSRQAAMQLGMPTLIGMYIWSLSRAGRFHAVE